MMTDSPTDNEISVELVGTSRPSDSIETDREDSHQLYQHENRDHTDTSPPRDTQAVEVTIDRGRDIEHRSRNLLQNMIYQRKS